MSLFLVSDNKYIDNPDGLNEKKKEVNDKIEGLRDKNKSLSSTVACLSRELEFYIKASNQYVAIARHLQQRVDNIDAPDTNLIKDTYHKTQSFLRTAIGHYDQELSEVSKLQCQLSKPKVLRSKSNEVIASEAGEKLLGLEVEVEKTQEYLKKVDLAFNLAAEKLTRKKELVLNLIKGVVLSAGFKPVSLSTFTANLSK